MDTDDERKRALSVFDAAIRKLRDKKDAASAGFATGGLVKPDQFNHQYLNQPLASGGSLPRKRVAEVYIMASGS